MTSIKPFDRSLFRQRGTLGTSLTPDRKPPTEVIAGSIAEMKDLMRKVTVHVNLYGSLARLGNGKYVAELDTELDYGACKTDLLAKLGIPEEEKGYVFINSVLHDVPGLTTESGQVLEDGDHIGIFSVDRLWPYQYRDGVRMSEALKEKLRLHGAMHHSYS